MMEQEMIQKENSTRNEGSRMNEASVLSDPRRDWLHAGDVYQIKPVFDVENPQGDDE